MTDESLSSEVTKIIAKLRSNKWVLPHSPVSESFIFFVQTRLPFNIHFLLVPVHLLKE